MTTDTKNDKRTSAGRSAARREAEAAALAARVAARKKARPGPVKHLAKLAEQEAKAAKKKAPASVEWIQDVRERADDALTDSVLSRRAGDASLDARLARRPGASIGSRQPAAAEANVATMTTSPATTGAPTTVAMLASELGAAHSTIQKRAREFGATKIGKTFLIYPNVAARIRAALSDPEKMGPRTRASIESLGEGIKSAIERAPAEPAKAKV